MISEQRGCALLHPCRCWEGDLQCWHHGIDYLQAAIRAVSGDCVDGPLWAFNHDADVVPDSAARHNSPANATLLVTAANLDGEP